LVIKGEGIKHAPFKALTGDRLKQCKGPRSPVKGKGIRGNFIKKKKGFCSTVKKKSTYNKGNGIGNPKGEGGNIDEKTI